MRIESAKLYAYRLIDRRAEALRRLVATGGDLQQQVYRKKEEESERCLLELASLLPPMASNYPMLSADISVYGVTLAQAAQNVSDNVELYEAAGAVIEVMRLGAKLLVEESSDLAVIQAAPDAITQAAFVAALQG